MEAEQKTAVAAIDNLRLLNNGIAKQRFKTVKAAAFLLR